MMETDDAALKGPTGGKTILIVEDDAAIGEFLVQAIQQETPYQAVLALDGSRAWKMLHTLTPDLFILDYNLPDMNGLQFYDRLRALKALAHRPVLIISAEAALIQNEVKARQLPQLTKPFELNDLLEAIERLFTSS